MNVRMRPMAENISNTNLPARRNLKLAEEQRSHDPFFLACDAHSCNYEAAEKSHLVNVER